MSVVHLRGRDDAGTDASKRCRLLERCGELAQERLRALLAQMLDRADDALFELAEKAENNALQRAYFDAMREVRLKRAEIEERYARDFAAGLAEVVQAPVRGGAAVAISLEALGLVDEDAVEEDIAISNMVAKIATAGREELYALDRRVAFLLSRTETDPGDNPLGPRAVCGAMRTATRQIESGIEVRLLVLKLFDRYVVGGVTGIYQALNRYLIDHQVLPDIRPAVRRTAGLRVPGGVPVPGAAASGPVSEAALLDVLRTLVAQGNGEAGPAPAGGSGAGIPQVALSALTGLQQGAGPAVALAAGIDPQALAAGTVNVVRPIAASSLLASLEGPQRMTVDIVALLFDYVLADPALPDTLKAQIGRLQIPMVKVALLDATFFSRKSHPARRLLDALAESAVRVRDDPAAGAALQSQAESIVQRVLREFESDVSVFGPIVADFERFLATELEAVARRAERVDRAVHGRERMEQAKVYARNAVERCVARHGHDDLVYSFLLNHWKTLIITSHVECGEDSAAVAEAARTMDDLAWSVTPKRTTADRERLTAMLPGLVRRLQHGMHSVSAPPAARTRFLERLAQRHAEVMRTVQSSPPGGGDATASASDALCERTLPEGTTGEALVAAGTTVDDCERTLPEGTRQLVPAADEDPCDRTLPEGVPAEERSDAGCERTLPAGGDEALRGDADATDPWPGVPDAEADPCRDAPALETAVSFAGEAAAQVVDAPEDSSEETMELPSLVAAQPGDDLPVIDAGLLPQAGGEASVPGPAAIEPAFASTADLAQLFELAASGGMDVDEIIAGGDYEVEDVTMGDEEPADPAAGDPALALVTTLVPGTWFEFTLDRGGTGRGRLQPIEADADLLVFLDRQGRRLIDRTRAGLAADLRRGSARIVSGAEDVTPLLERAFGRLLDGLAGNAS